MGRAKYTSCALAVLAWTGASWGQPPAAQSAGDPVITVQEIGKATHQCVVLSTTILPDGSRSYEVQALDSGRRFTIQEPSPGRPLDANSSGNSHGAFYRLFHRNGTDDGSGPAWSMQAPPAVPSSAPVNAFSVQPSESGAGTPSAFTPPPVKQPNAAAAFPVGPGGPQSVNAFLQKSSNPSQPNNAPAPASQPAPVADASAETAGAMPAAARAMTHLPAPATVEAAPARAGRTTTPAAPSEGGSASVNQGLPQADGSRPDPLMSLETYTTWPPKKKNDHDAMAAPEAPVKAARAGSAASAQPTGVSKPPVNQVSAPIQNTDGKSDRSSEEEAIAPGLGSKSVLAAGSGFFGPNAFVPAATPPTPSAPPPVPPAPVPPGGFAPPPPPPPPAVMPNAFNSPPDANADAVSSGAFHSASWYRMRELGNGGAFPNNQAAAQATAPALGQQPIMQAGFQQPAPPAPSVEMLTMTLREALLPSVREAAAERLATVADRADPGIVDSLLSSARHDPCPAVRAACLHTLVQLQVHNVLMRVTLEELKNDKDVAVRQEAADILRTASWQTEAR